MLKIFTKEEDFILDGCWDEYVMHSDNGTIFNQYRFLSYHPEERFDIISLAFKRKRKIVALITFALQKKDGKTVLSSFPGASWGGFIYEKPLTYKYAKEVVELLIDYAKDKCQRIEIAMPPVIYQETSNDNLTFCLLKQGFSYLKRELTNVIDLRKKELTFDRSVRKAVNKSIKSNIRISFDPNNADDFYDLLVENIAEKGGKPTHSYRELISLKDMYYSKIHFITAFKDEKLVGGLCNWLVKDRIWLIFYSCYDKAHMSDRILNRLFYEAIMEYKKENARFIDFGTSSINMEVNEGLMNFKELYSAYGMFRDTLYLDFE